MQVVYELPALAAAIISGVTFKGENGTIIGATLGVLLMGMVINALNILGLCSYAQKYFFRRLHCDDDRCQPK